MDEKQANTILISVLFSVVSVVILAIFFDFTSPINIDYSDIESTQLRAVISWQLSKQLQFVGLSLTMVVSYIGLLIRNFKTDPTPERGFYMAIITSLNFVFNIAFFRLLSSYRFIAELEQHLDEKTLINQMLPPWHNFILKTNPFIMIVAIIIFSFVWEIIGFYKIRYLTVDITRD